MGADFEEVVSRGTLAHAWRASLGAAAKRDVSRQAFRERRLADARGSATQTVARHPEDPTGPERHRDRAQEDPGHQDQSGSEASRTRVKIRKPPARAWPFAASALGAAYTGQGRPAEALPLLEQVVERAVSMKLRANHPLRLAWLAEAHGAPADRRPHFPWPPRPWTWRANSASAGTRRTRSACPAKVWATRGGRPEPGRRALPEIAGPRRAPRHTPSRRPLPPRPRQLVPRDLGERRELDVVETPPWPAPPDDLRLVQPNHALGERVVVRIAGAPDRRFNAGGREAL